jgi:drug/metabolite transporter (DMT)-like permease
MFLWGSSFVALKLAFRAYDPVVVIFGRMAVASIAFLPVMLYLWRSGLRLWGRDWKYILLMCLCEPCLYFLFEAAALHYTSSSQAGMITTILPLLVAVGASLFLHERITRRTIVGFVLAIAGACWLSWGGQATQSAPNPILGNFYEFVAMICATGYILLLKKLTSSYSPAFLTGMQAMVGAVFYFPALFLPSTTWPTHWAPVSALAIIYLGLFITLGAYGLYNFGVSRIPASRATAYANLIPVIAVLLGWLLLNERFTPSQYLASGLVFIGVYLSQDKQKRAAGIAL